MGLARPARGLPRLMLDVGFWTAPRFAGISVAAIGLHVCAVSYCYRHELDGEVPGPAPRLAGALGVPPDGVPAALKELLEVGVWTERAATADQAAAFILVGYVEDHPSAAEVRSQREGRRLRALKGAHARYHGENADPSCPFCSPTEDASSIPAGMHEESSEDGPQHDVVMPMGEGEVSKPEPAAELPPGWVAEGLSLLREGASIDEAVESYLKRGPGPSSRTKKTWLKWCENQRPLPPGPQEPAPPRQPCEVCGTKSGFVEVDGQAVRCETCNPAPNLQSVPA